MLRSPLHPLPRLGADLGVELRVKRDDLAPVPGGGNKLRKLLAILAEPDARDATALVTTGGTQSNHARVTALLAAERGLRCALVLHGRPDELDAPAGNLRLARLAGAEVRIVEPLGIRAALDAAMKELAGAGETPLLVPGGGHSAAGALAYVRAVEEASEQLDGWVPDHIVLASGTGATQAGIVAGCRRAGWPTRVIGVSVAREAERGGAAVREVLDALDPRETSAAGLRVECRDEWRAGGYERVDDATLGAIRHAARREGLLLDPTYTGKAFAGLMDLVRQGEIEPGQRVLFWHTGGLVNLLHSPLDITG